MNKIIRNIFVRNWGLKLFSFLLALVVWLIIIPEEKLPFDKSVTVPLELHNLPAGMYIIEYPPATIDVTVKAPQRMIDMINPDTVQARLELGAARVEQTEFPINRNMISLPQGAEIKDISPSQVRMILERSREVMLEIEADLIGNLQEGLELERVDVIPNEVAVIGPESKVKDTYKVRTSPIDLSTLTESIEMETDLILPDSALRIVSFETVITVSIIIVKKTQEEQVPEKKKKKKAY